LIRSRSRIEKAVKWAYALAALTGALILYAMGNTGVQAQQNFSDDHYQQQANYSINSKLIDSMSVRQSEMNTRLDNMDSRISTMSDRVSTMQGVGEGIFIVLAALQILAIVLPRLGFSNGRAEHYNYEDFK